MRATACRAHGSSRSRASRAAWVRLVVPSLRKIWRRCTFTVVSQIASSCAISLFWRPLARLRSTSSSLGVNSSAEKRESGRGAAGAAWGAWAGCSSCHGKRQRRAAYQHETQALHQHAQLDRGREIAPYPSTSGTGDARVAMVVADDRQRRAGERRGQTVHGQDRRQGPRRRCRHRCAPPPAARSSVSQPAVTTQAAGHSARIACARHSRISGRPSISRTVASRPTAGACGTGSGRYAGSATRAVSSTLELGMIPRPPLRDRRLKVSRSLDLEQPIGQMQQKTSESSRRCRPCRGAVWQESRNRRRGPQSVEGRDRPHVARRQYYERSSSPASRHCRSYPIHAGTALVPLGVAASIRDGLGGFGGLVRPSRGNVRRKRVSWRSRQSGARRRRWCRSSARGVAGRGGHGHRGDPGSRRVHVASDRRAGGPAAGSAGSSPHPWSPSRPVRSSPRRARSRCCPAPSRRAGPSQPPAEAPRAASAAVRGYRLSLAGAGPDRPGRSGPSPDGRRSRRAGHRRGRRVAGAGGGGRGRRLCRRARSRATATCC